MDTQKYERQLEKMRQDYQSLLHSIAEGGLQNSLQESISELSSYDNHPADLGSEVFERSKDLALRDNALIQLQKIDNALDMIKQGTYGFCTSCGEKIPAARLEAAPETTLCLSCRQKSEGPAERHPRPIEEDVIVPPFGGITHDSSPEDLGDAEDENMYDGEDTWQEVARYGTSETPSDDPNAWHFPDVYYDYDEDVGFVENVDHIPYKIDEDGIIYEDLSGRDDEGPPHGR